MPRRVSPTRFTSAKGKSLEITHTKKQKQNMILVYWELFNTPIWPNASGVFWLLWATVFHLFWEKYGKPHISNTSYHRQEFFLAGWRWWAEVQSMCFSGVWTWAPRCPLPGHIYRSMAGPELASQHPLRFYEAGLWSSWDEQTDECIKHLRDNVFNLLFSVFGILHIGWINNIREGLFFFCAKAHLKITNLMKETAMSRNYLIPLPFDKIICLCSLVLTWAPLLCTVSGGQSRQ